MTWLPVSVSIAALLFAVVSFWWTHWRRGKLHVSTPRHYAASLTPQRAILLLPLPILNSGPVPFVITDLRMRTARDQPWWQWQRTRTEVRPEKGSVSMATPFIIEGRAAKVVFAEFQLQPAFQPKRATCNVKLEARYGHKKTWSPLVTIPIRIAEAAEQSNFIAYSNSVD